MFENIVYSTAWRQTFHPCRIPDGCKQLSNTKLIRVKSPFDFILAAPNGRCIFIDCKTTKAKKFNFSSIVEHQIDMLFGFEKCGHKAGYLIHFQETNDVVFFSASQFISNKRGSLGPMDGLVIGKEMDFNLRKIF